MNDLTSVTLPLHEAIHSIERVADVLDDIVEGRGDVYRDLYWALLAVSECDVVRKGLFIIEVTAHDKPAI